MDASRKPLANVEGRKHLRLSKLTVAYRGTPSLDDWCVYIVNGTKTRKYILVDRTSERRAKNLLVKLQTLTKSEVERLAKG